MTKIKMQKNIEFWRVFEKNCFEFLKDSCIMGAYIRFLGEKIW